MQISAYFIKQGNRCGYYRTPGKTGKQERLPEGAHPCRHGQIDIYIYPHHLYVNMQHLYATSIY